MPFSWSPRRGSSWYGRSRGGLFLSTPRRPGLCWALLAFLLSLLLGCSL